MGYETYVRFVDAHTECDRRDDDQSILGKKAALIFSPDLGGESGVVRQRLKVLIAQPGGDALSFFARQAVNNSCFAAMRLEKFQ